MSHMIAAPRPPAPAAAEALFAEARRRRRRRRLTGLVVALALAAAAAAAFTVARPDHAPASRGAAAARPRPVSGPRPALAGYVAWVDYNRRVHLGDLASGAQRVVGRSTADPAVPLVRAGGHLYWADYWAGLAGHREVVQELNPATGRVRSVGPGGRSPFSVFTSADGRHVFLAPMDTKVIELPARGSGAKRVLTLPGGWYLPSGGSVGVAHGILVQSGGQTTRPDSVIAVWNPGTGALKTIGRGSWAMAAYTPPGARYSLLALMPARCSAGQNCPLKITNTATLSTKTLRSPLHHGFATGAAFSPDGKQLAVFADRNYPGTGAVQLAMVNTGTGTLRLADSTRLAIGEDRAWALWLPDGRHLITGAVEASYAVNTATLSARPLFFTHARDHYIETSQDINYSAILIPPRR
jgi:hypothetical protein